MKKVNNNMLYINLYMLKTQYLELELDPPPKKNTSSGRITGMIKFDSKIAEICGKAEKTHACFQYITHSFSQNFSNFSKYN